MFDYDFIFIHDIMTEQMYKNSKVKYAYGTRIRVVSPEDLIISKLHRLVISRNIYDASDILALASQNVLDARYLCSAVKRNDVLNRVLRDVIEEADTHRFGSYNLAVGAKRLSTCL